MSLVFVGRMHYQNFADSRQNHLFSTRDKNTVFQNDRFDNPDFWTSLSPHDTFSAPLARSDFKGLSCKPRHASAFSTHSDSQAVPSCHCIRIIGHFSRRACS